MYSRKIALAHARQIRRCPPYALLKSRHHSAELKLHLNICPHCREDLETASMEVLANKLAGPDMGMKTAAGTEAAVGQLRYIQPEKSGWLDGYHYNPPMVVVLEIGNRISDDIRVAQVYDDIVLAAPGDLILDDDRSGAGDLFVECWNTYTLKSSHLGAGVGQVGPEVIEAIHWMAENAEETASWAPLPFPMTADDPRIHFRELEVETAFFFSAQAAGELMVELESSRLRLAYASPAELTRDIGEKVPDIRFPVQPNSFEEALTMPEFPEYLLPLAAADTMEKTITGKRVIFKDGLLAGFDPIEITVFNIHDLEDGKVGFSGCVPVTPDIRPVDLVFRFAASDGILVEPAAEPRWDPETGAFAVVFDTASRDRHKLRVAVLCEAVEAAP